jgi:outer membrane lipoprotein SlyB
MNLKLATLALLAVVLLAGCAGGLGSRDYERAQARRVYEVQMGVVENVRAVQLEGTKSAVGAVGGAAVGGIAGSTIGSGKGSAVAAVLGAVAGGVAGAAAEEAVTKQPGLEITLRLDNGRVIAVTQADDGEKFNVGDRVRLLESGGEARVTH